MVEAGREGNPSRQREWHGGRIWGRRSQKIRKIWCVMRLSRKAGQECASIRLCK
jgi:hypothetical protein